MKHEQYQQNTVVGPDVPSFEDFREEIMTIYPEGDLLKSFSRLKWYIENEKVCPDGTPITYRLIMDKFASHIKAWNMVYGSRDPKYWGKGAQTKRKNLWDFIGLQLYEREFVISVGNGNRSSYLFGEFSISYLKKRLEEFKRRILNETHK